MTHSISTDDRVTFRLAILEDGTPALQRLVKVAGSRVGYFKYDWRTIPTVDLRKAPSRGATK